MGFKSECFGRGLVAKVVRQVFRAIRELQVTGTVGVPAGISAVAMTVTVDQTENPRVGGGYVTVFPCGTVPNTSNLNFTGGQNTGTLSSLRCQRPARCVSTCTAPPTSSSTSPVTSRREPKALLDAGALGPVAVASPRRGWFGLLIG